MNRRHLVILAAATTLIAPVPLRAQGQRTGRICVLHHDPRGNPDVEPIFRRFGELGWTEGRNLNVQYRVTALDSALNVAAVKEFVRLKCDVILAYNTPSALAAKAGAPSIPLVFAVGGDPVAIGLAQSLARPGGNATGLSHMLPELGIKQLGLLRELTTAAKRVAVMFEADNPSMLNIFKGMQAAADRLGISLRPFELRGWKDVDDARSVLLREPDDGLIVLLDRVTADKRAGITRLATQLRLPTCLRGPLFRRSRWAAVLRHHLEGTGDAHRRLRGARPERGEAREHPGAAADPLRAARQSERRPRAGHLDTAIGAAACHRGDQLMTPPLRPTSSPSHAVPPCSPPAHTCSGPCRSRMTSARRAAFR